MRLYALHKTPEVNLEPAGGQVFIGERPLSSPARLAVKGNSVTLEGGMKTGPAKTLTLYAYGPGVWLSGKDLPRRLYRGSITFSAEAGSIKAINTVDLEIYLAGVVSGEAADLSQAEAYKAQAVAARTYTVTHMYNHAKEGYNMCDTPHCQLYAGLGAISAKAREASDATRGELLLYKGRPAEAFYHSACGGRTETMTYVWPFEHKPYLVSVRDGPAGAPYCAGAPGFFWRTKIYFTGLTRLARTAGWIAPEEDARGLRVSAWGASGRAAELEIYTRTRRITVTATDFYHGVGRGAGWQAVKSSYFKIFQGKDYVLLEGAGSGHGVGMCQWGAEGMGKKGFTYREILRHYYPGTEISHD
ncbi:MAG TPA: SpoIID/LytB domain-containing protein [Elusimicrobiales bacterium]|nr:SpoIID/LytB domain-containing protein [Elusimicrobiales bacterium]